VPEVPATFYVVRVKRGLDIVGAAVLLILLSPVIAICAAAILIDDGPPIFYSHERVGKDGRPFKVHKLRTMTVGTDRTYGGYPAPASITKVGTLLRRLSLDEFPQLVNIVAGQMSFVGPRPTIASQVQRYTPEQRGRLAVRPGLTGLAQIRYRDSAPWSVRIASDLEYVRSLSFRGDLLIALRTVPAVMSGQGQMGGTPAQIDDLGAGAASTESNP
jgi:lipopolysaccharide/colanic/teichoic acid biosynthesis glycosyltransferase